MVALLSVTPMVPSGSPPKGNIVGARHASPAKVNGPNRPTRFRRRHRRLPRLPGRHKNRRPFPSVHIRRHDGRPTTWFDSQLGAVVGLNRNDGGNTSREPKNVGIGPDHGTPVVGTVLKKYRRGEACLARQGQ